MLFVARGLSDLARLLDQMARGASLCGRGGRSPGRTRARTPAARLALERLESRELLSVGGGFTGGGVAGEYFNNTTLSGTPSFTRQDVRIDFDWGSTGKPGGSISTGYRDLGADYYSVRWTGQLIPRFSETYTFRTTSDDGVRLYLKKSTDSTWTTLIDNWTLHGPTDNTASFALTAGTTYDVKMEYYENNGAAVARLRWSGPSTPEEVIEPFSVSGINAVTYNSWTYADAMKMGRDQWIGTSGQDVAVDANGWPLADSTNIVWEGAEGPDKAGTYLLQFHGKADVSTSFNVGQFSAGGTSYGTTLPSGAGYDAATNTTTATMTVAASNPGILYLAFRNTRRTASSAVNTGVTDVRLMRPTAVGATTWYDTGTTFDRSLEDAYARFTTLRWLTANFNNEVNWSDRVLPSFQKANDGSTEVWEYLVMLANETGKDLYITVPMKATDAYVTNLANLIRYGSDGVNPYTGPQANPVYAPLNPNLRVYVEWSNEIWNWSFTQAGDGAAAARDAVHNNTPDGQIVNFDGNAPDGDFRRWSALRTVRTSDIFRGVFGDPAMGDRVRILLEYQYDNFQDTAAEAFRFLDNYFNNGDGQQHVTTPHPVRYYVWGAGGAAYYGASNPNGNQTAIAAGNASFEGPAVAAGTALVNPAGATWTFTGNAGIYHDNARAPAAVSQTLGTSRNSLAADSALGYQFTVGAADVAVYDLGRWVASGNGQTHTVRILRASDRSTVASVDVNTSGATAGQYRYASLTRPVILSANTTYYIVSSERNGADSFYDQDTTITPHAGITINNAVSATYGNPSWDTTTWTFSAGSAGSHAYGPVDFRFTTSGVGSLGFAPDAPDGSQALFLDSTGSVSQTVSFTSPGVYALQFNAAQPTGSFIFGIEIYVDGNRITPYGSTYKVNPGHWEPGAWARDGRDFLVWGSAPFTISQAGSHTIKFVGDGTAGHYMLLDNVKIASVDAIFASGIPGAGQANGQVAIDDYQAQLDSQAKYAEAYGLKVVAYEGGWSLGGDFGQLPIQSWAKYKDPRARQANVDSLDAFTRSGGALYVFGTYDQWPGNDNDHAATYPLPQGVDDRNAVLPVEPANGVSVPATLAPVSRTWDSGNSNGTLSPNGWINWNVLSSVTSTYTLAVSTGTGGTFRLEVDGQALGSGASGGTSSFVTTLTKGLHAVRVKAVSGSFAVTSVAVTIPTAPSDLAASAGSGLVGLSWTAPAVGTVTGYNIYRATSPGGEGSMPINSSLITGTSYVDSGVTNGTTYYYTVAAVTGSGVSAGSNEASVTPAVVVVLDGFNFNGKTGDEASTVPTTVAPGVTAGPITRGSGLQPANTTYFPSSFKSIPVGNVYATDLAGAQARNQLYTFTVSAASGTTLSLSSITFAAWAQNGETAFGAGLQYSTDGTTFTTVPLTGSLSGSGWWAPRTTSADLSGIAALQDTTATVTFRIYLFGVGAYEVSGLGRVSGNGLSITGSEGASATPPQAPTGLAAAAGDGQVSLSWTAPPGPVTGYNVYRGTSPDGESSTPVNSSPVTSTSYTDTGLTNGTHYYYKVAAVNAAGTGALSAEAGATPAGSIFTASIDIGAPGKAGSSSFANGTYTVKGGGADIYGTADHFRYTYKPFSGDGTIIARVASLTTANAKAKAGVMFRASTAANAMFADVVITPGNGVLFQWRSSTGGPSRSIQVAGVTAPRWVKLVRTGNVFTAFYSSNGTTWIQIGSGKTIAMPSAATVGLAVTAHNNAALATATFTNVSVAGS